jgi:hypothetical protein
LSWNEFGRSAIARPRNPTALSTKTKKKILFSLPVVLGGGSREARNPTVTDPGDPAMKEQS